MNNDLPQVPYAPMTWRDGPIWQYARDVAKAGFIAEDGGIDINLPEMIDSQLVSMYLSRATRAVETGQLPQESLMSLVATCAGFRHWIPMIGQYELQGRQLFEISEGLAEMLANTDQGSCTLQDITLPYHAIYIHLGMQEEAKAPYDRLADGVNTFEYVVGAFVATADYDAPGELRGKRLKIGLTTATADGRLNEVPLHYFDIRPEEARLPVAEAIKVATKRRAVSLKNALASRHGESASQWFESFAQDTSALIEKSMPLIMNALFYLEDASNGAVLQPGRGTPADLAARWHAAGPRRHKVEQAMFRDGHTVVRLLGADIRHSRELDAESYGIGSGGQLPTHWRRGHFREQAHGPKLSLRKRILIKPVLVNKLNTDPMDVDGHIYKVGRPGKGMR